MPVVTITVATLVFSTSKAISQIIQAAERASHKKEKCSDLAGRLSGISNLLPLLEQQLPEAEEELARLGDTLDDAHELVLSCQRSSLRRKFTRSKRFSEVNGRIDSHLRTIQLYCDMTRCPDSTRELCSDSLTVATYGQSMRKRDVIKGLAYVAIGRIFHKPEYTAKGTSKFLE